MATGCFGGNCTYQYFVISLGNAEAGLFVPQFLETKLIHEPVGFLAQYLPNLIEESPADSPCYRGSNTARFPRFSHRCQPSINCTLHIFDCFSGGIPRNLVKSRNFRSLTPPATRESFTSLAQLCSVLLRRASAPKLDRHLMYGYRTPTRAAKILDRRVL